MVVSCVIEGGLDALLALLHNSIWKADDVHAGEALSGIYFDLDDHTIQTEHGAGVNAG
jgi:hypothetical protein